MFNNFKGIFHYSINHACCRYLFLGFHRCTILEAQKLWLVVHIILSVGCIHLPCCPRENTEFIMLAPKSLWTRTTSICGSCLLFGWIFSLIIFWLSPFWKVPWVLWKAPLPCFHKRHEGHASWWVHQVIQRIENYD